MKEPWNTVDHKLKYQQMIMTLYEIKFCWPRYNTWEQSKNVHITIQCELLRSVCVMVGGHAFLKPLCINLHTTTEEAMSYFGKPRDALVLVELFQLTCHAVEKAGSIYGTNDRAWKIILQSWGKIPMTVTCPQQSLILDVVDPDWDCFMWIPFLHRKTTPVRIQIDFILTCE